MENEKNKSFGILKCADKSNQKFKVFIKELFPKICL